MGVFKRIILIVDWGEEPYSYDQDSVIREMRHMIKDDEFNWGCVKFVELE